MEWSRGVEWFFGVVFLEWNFGVVFWSGFLESKFGVVFWSQNLECISAQIIRHTNTPRCMLVCTDRQIYAPRHAKDIQTDRHTNRNR